MNSASFQQGQKLRICAAMPVGTSIKRLLDLENQTDAGKADFERSHVSTAEAFSNGPDSRSFLGKRGSFVPLRAELQGKNALSAKPTQDSMQTSRNELEAFNTRNGLRGSRSGMTLLAKAVVSAEATCTRTTSSRGKKAPNSGTNWTMASRFASPATRKHIALLENAVKSVKLLTGKAEDNTEPSLSRKALEGVTTRGRAYRRIAPTAVIASTSAAAERHEIVWTAWRHAEVGHKQASDNTSISPMDTWFMTGAARGSCKSTTHEWLTDALTVAGANKAIEGDDFSANVRTQPSRLKNYTQISRKDVQVTGTSRATDNAGMADILSRHTARMSKEIKRDMEFEMLNNNPASAGTSPSPRVSGGVPNWIYSGQHYKTSAQTLQTTTAPVSGFATATGGSWTNSATAYVETDLRDMLKLAWSTGGDIDTVLCDSVAFNKFSTFTGVATRFRDVGSKQPAQIIGFADVYVSPYGQHKLVLSRYMPANSAYCLQMDMWEVAYLRNFQLQDIAKVGDGDRKSLLAEWTLVSKNPLANAKAHGVA